MCGRASRADGDVLCILSVSMDMQRHCLTRWMRFFLVGGCWSGQFKVKVMVVKRFGLQNEQDWKAPSSLRMCRGM
ncbi:hypothetical protein EYF80_002426 [Liparis tanakae]|uniref:Uncharacterized protein n=1 Tax=Liparis tanakae TaxID=230148 RepID=A0A4Z2JBL2_9TELE|nr:hypothetical protein EYF80_002426 [Liparis tanakae]